VVKAAISGVLGFVLLFIESMIVIKLKGIETIDFGGIAPFVNVWAMNFFFVFAIITQVTNWFENKEALKEDNAS
jgi:hypothetical protein